MAKLDHPDHAEPFFADAGGEVPIEEAVRRFHAQPGVGSLVKSVAGAVAPSITSMVTDPTGRELPPPAPLPEEPGKVPPTPMAQREQAAQFEAGMIPATLASPGGGIPGEAASIASRLAPAVEGRLAAALPEAGVAARGVQPAEAALFGATGLGAAARPSAAAAAPTTIEGPGERPSTTSEESQRIIDLNNQIGKLNQQRMKATAGKGPKGAQVIAQPFDAQIATLNDQVKTINEQVTARQNAWEARKAEFEKQTAPFVTRDPSTANLLKAMPAASGLAGFLLGRGAFSRYAGNIPASARANTYMAGAGGGALEGLIGGGYPTYADLAMPEGTVAKTTAERNIRDPGFLASAIAPEVIGSTLTGALGSKYGMTGPLTRALAPHIYGRMTGERRFGELAPPAAREAPAAALPAPGPTIEASAIPAARAPAGPPVTPIQDSAGMWRHPETKRFMPAPPNAPPRRPPPPAEPAAPAIEPPADIARRLRTLHEPEL